MTLVHPVDLDGLHFEAGKHDDHQAGRWCVMEALAWHAGEPAFVRVDAARDAAGDAAGAALAPTVTELQESAGRLLARMCRATR
jgi:hypothetical protein